MKSKYILLYLASFLLCSCESDNENLDVDTSGYIELKNGMSVEKVSDSCYIYELDIILTQEQIENLETFDQIIPESRTKGTMINGSKYYWKDRTIYYTINANVEPGLRMSIVYALGYWGEQTKLIFKERKNEKNYVEFLQVNNYEYGGTSNVGCIGGRQYIKLHQAAQDGTVMHEIGHAVGMLHEHQSWAFHDFPNASIVFHWDNIQPKYKAHFQKHKASHTTYNAGIVDPGYPTNSIMAYGSYNNFAIDRSKPVMSIKSMFGGLSTWTAASDMPIPKLSISDRMAVAAKYGYTYNP